MPGDQIDPMQLDKPYYLEPERNGAKPYALLRDALKSSDRVAVVTVSLRQRMTPAVLRVRDDVLVMQTLLWPDEIREPQFASLDDVGEASPKELKMAELLLETLAGDYDPADFEDDYAAALHQLVEQKLEGGEVTKVKEEQPSSGEVVDLLAALQKSVAAAKSARGEADADDETADEAPAEEDRPKKTQARRLRPRRPRRRPPRRPPPRRRRPERSRSPARAAGAGRPRGASTPAAPTATAASSPRRTPRPAAPRWADRPRRTPTGPQRQGGR